MARTTLVRVLTLNVWNLVGDRARQGALRAGIAALRPDLVALQEVVLSAERNQLAELLDGLDLRAFHQNDMLDSQSFPFGIALASRWQPQRVEMTVLPGSQRNSEPQCAIAAAVPLPAGPTVLFMSVKPSWRLDDEANRVLQANAIAQFEAKLRCDVPTIIAGDFDATPDSDSMRYLTGKAVVNGHSTCFHDAWTIAGDGGPGYTWTSDNPLGAPEVERLVGQPGHARRIDYVLVGWRHNHPHATARVRRCDVVLADPPVSDHYGVLADIEVSG